MLEPGDSGGPLLAKNGAGELTLLGTNWTVGGTTFSAAYLGNVDAEVQNFVDAHTIPEPGSALLLLPGLFGGLLIRRCRRGAARCRSFSGAAGGVTFNPSPATIQSTAT